MHSQDFPLGGIIFTRNDLIVNTGSGFSGLSLVSSMNSQMIILQMLAMLSYICPPGSSIYPPHEFIGNVGNEFSYLYNSCEHLSLKGLFWGCWECILILEHQLATFLKQMILLGMLRMHSHVCPPVAALFHQIILLKMITMHSKACTIVDSCFTKNDYFRNAGNVFSCSDTSWHHFSQKLFYLGCWECIHKFLHQVTAYFPQIILLGMLALHSYFCKIGAKIFPRNYCFRSICYEFSCSNNCDNIFPQNDFIGVVGNRFSRLYNSWEHSLPPPRPPNFYFGNAGNVFTCSDSWWQHLSNKSSYWGFWQCRPVLSLMWKCFPPNNFWGECWQCILTFVHQLATWSQRWLYKGSWQCILSFLKQVATFSPKIYRCGSSECILTSVHQVAAFPHHIILFWMLPTHSHVCPLCSGIFSTKWFSWGCWKCMLTLVHQLAAFTDHGILLWMLAMHSHICLTTGVISTQKRPYGGCWKCILMLKHQVEAFCHQWFLMLEMQSQFCPRGAHTFSPNDCTRDAGNTFSH